MATTGEYGPVIQSFLNENLPTDPEARLVFFDALQSALITYTGNIVNGNGHGAESVIEKETEQQLSIPVENIFFNTNALMLRKALVNYPPNPHPEMQLGMFVVQEPYKRLTVVERQLLSESPWIKYYENLLQLTEHEEILGFSLLVMKMLNPDMFTISTTPGEGAKKILIPNIRIINNLKADKIKRPAIEISNAFIPDNHFIGIDIDQIYSATGDSDTGRHDEENYKLFIKIINSWLVTYIRNHMLYEDQILQSNYKGAPGQTLVTGAPSTGKTKIIEAITNAKGKTNTVTCRTTTERTSEDGQRVVSKTQNATTLSIGNISGLTLDSPTLQRAYISSSPVSQKGDVLLEPLAIHGRESRSPVVHNALIEIGNAYGINNHLKKALIPVGTAILLSGQTRPSIFTISSKTNSKFLSRLDRQDKSIRTNYRDMYHNTTDPDSISVELALLKRMAHLFFSLDDTSRLLFTLAGTGQIQGLFLSETQVNGLADLLSRGEGFTTNQRPPGFMENHFADTIRGLDILVKAGIAEASKQEYLSAAIGGIQFVKKRSSEIVVLGSSNLINRRKGNFMERLLDEIDVLLMFSSGNRKLKQPYYKNMISLIKSFKAAQIAIS